MVFKNYYLSPVVAVVFLCFLGAVSCSQTQPRKVSSLNDVLEALKDIDEERGMRNGMFAFSLKQVKNQETLINHNADKSVVLASNMKVVTTAAALDILGEDFTFKTRLEYDGEILPDGTLSGNLYLTGGGDPTLGSKRVRGSFSTEELMSLFLQKIRNFGIRKVSGAVIADADFFEENAVPPGWTWSDMGNYFGAAAFGLNFNDNMYRLTFRSATQEGMPTQVLRIEPRIPELVVSSTVKTGKPGSGDNAYIYGAIYGNHQFIEGTIPAGTGEFAIRGAIPDPPQTCAEALTAYLGNHRIPVVGNATTTRLMRQEKRAVNIQRKTIYSHESPLLRDIVGFTNLYSMNLYAEVLAKMTGKKIYDEGSTYSGVNAIRNHWFKNGIKNAGFFMRDGSGLSRSNATTVSQLTDILLYCTKQSFFGAFYNSLPVAGATGTMTPIARGTAAAGNLRAKTGSIERVKSYTGYFRSQSGELYAFSMIANDYEMPGELLDQKMEKVMALLALLP